MQNSYDLIADKWHAYSRDQGYLERALGYVDKILRDLPPNATVLDLGCGTGLPIAKYIVEKGYRVLGVDQSKEMLEIARREVPKAEFIHADMIQVEFNQRFAAAIAWDSAFHVERKYHSGIYRKVANSLETGARFLLSVGGTGPEEITAGADGFTSEMFGETFFYSGYEPAFARKLIEREGFEIELWEVDDPSSHGHIAVIARKTSSANPPK